MTGSRILRFVCLLCCFAVTADAQQNASVKSVVSLTPALVEAGSPELIVIYAPGAKSVERRMAGAQAGVLSARTEVGCACRRRCGSGARHIDRTDHRADNRKDRLDLSQTIEIHPAHYRTGKAHRCRRSSSSQVLKSKKKLPRMPISRRRSSPRAHPSRCGTAVFARRFIRRPTDSFGTRRMFNGKLASIHKGMDFRAPMGTVVRASNSGVVVLARPSLLTRATASIIDHGLGLYTVSMHFSRIDVHEGQHVVAGDRLGLSGATGRVTGPHLHWAVRWQGAYLDPAKLLAAEPECDSVTIDSARNLFRDLLRNQVFFGLCRLQKPSRPHRRLFSVAAL